LKLKKKKALKKIGRYDKADLPELGLSDIDIKIDTGAFFSVIHCQNIRKIKENGEEKIVFNLLDPNHAGYNDLEVSINDFQIKTVRSSNGIEEERYAIESSIILFGRKYETLLTLTDRSVMRYPILIGRSLLKKHFLVDVSKKNLSYKKKLKG